MTHAYRLVQWNHHKRVYDAVLASMIAAYLAGFVGIGLALNPPPEEISAPILLMRALGTAAALLLHLILAIGPLARLTPRMAPVLYNRRHLGVTCFIVALLHALIAIGFYGGFGVVNPFSAVFAGPGVRPAFELYGLGALLILFVMAAISHDFWLGTLGPVLWKSLHMLVYPAYVLLVAHVAFGAIQSERSLLYPALLAIGIAGLTGLHLTAAWRERARDRDRAPAEDDGWVDLGPCDDIPDARARVVRLPGSGSVAVFRDGTSLHAVSNTCPHQGGPLGEGKIVNGCVTCPWHGHQFRPGDGCAPPPYTDTVPTHELRVRGGRVRLNLVPNAPGTQSPPAMIPGTEGPNDA